MNACGVGIVGSKDSTDHQWLVPVASRNIGINLEKQSVRESPYLLKKEVFGFHQQ